MKLTIRTTALPLRDMTSLLGARNDDPPLFQYEALNPGEIRLLQPADNGDGLSWKMQTYSLEVEGQLPEFDALSYTWGSQDQIFPIICDGRRIYVHHNLYTALPYLSRRHRFPNLWKKDKSPDCDSADRITEFLSYHSRWTKADTSDTNESLLRPIWIDAICINQRDEDEKSIQITMMPSIYSTAAQVWIWLGLCEEQVLIREAVGLLPMIIEAAKPPKDDVTQETGTNAGHADSPRCAVSEIGPNVWQAFLHLVANRWFRRLWVVQESVLAKETLFLCGDEIIPSAMLRNAIESAINLGCDFLRSAPVPSILSIAYNTYLFAIHDVVREMRSLSYKQSADPAEVTLFCFQKIFDMSKQQECLEPKDRVYGILGLFNSIWYHEISRILRSVNSVSNLYTLLSLMFLIEPRQKVSYKNFEKKMRADRIWAWFQMAFIPDRMPGLPSWVPDLHRRVSKGISLYLIDPGHTIRFQACNKPSRLLAGPTIEQLIIRGQTIDVVAHTFAIIEPGAQHEMPYSKRLNQSALSVIREATTRAEACAVLSNSNPCTDEITLLERYWRTFLLDSTSDEHGQLSFEMFENYAKAADQVMIDWETPINGEMYVDIALITI